MNVVISVGGRFHMFDLARELVKQNFLARLITSYPAFEVKKNGVPTSYVRSIILKEIIQRLWGIFPKFIRYRYDSQFVIHQMYDFLASKNLIKSDILVVGSSMGLITMREARRLGSPIIILERGSTHILYQDRILREEYQRLGIPMNRTQLAHPAVIQKAIIEHEETDYISVPSQFVRESFLKSGIPSSKLIQVPYGVNLLAFRPVPKQDSVFRVIFAGGICIRKGVHYLLQAFAELALPNTELWLIGVVDDEMKPFLKKYAGTYKLIGKVPQGELYKYYSQGSVFCILSIEEGLALVQAQAMACGLPVIATTNTGAEDIIRDGIDGYIIPIRDVEKCKEKLQYFYENQERCRQMGENARQRVATGFTWDDYGRKMIAEYERILQERV